MTNTPARRYIDLSGYVFSGKHAVIDLLREFHGYCVAPFQFEFNLLRIQGGIRDLETALVDDWSPIRSDAAIRRFRHLTKRLACKNSWLRPSSWFSAVGWNYEDFFHGQFMRLSQKYLAHLIKTSWRADWPYPCADIPGTELFARKLLYRVGFKSALDFDIYLSAPDDFLGITRGYLAELLAAFVGEAPGVHSVVMHNSFEPFNPNRAIRYFQDAKAIIVDRDPRDSFVASRPHRHTGLPAREFIERYRTYRHEGERHGPDKNVLRIHFEDLVLDYDRALGSIRAFLGEDASVHVLPGKYFAPAASSANVGIWRTYDDQKEIDAIASELSDYCYE